MTAREQIRAALRGGWLSLRQISTLCSLSEKVIPAHLEHLRKSARAAGERFEIEPAVCNKCEFVFEDRGKLTNPSKCPACRGERIDPARFRIG